MAAGGAPSATATGADRIPVPDSWERGLGATFRGGARGMWLHFNRDADLACTDAHDICRTAGDRIHGAPIIRRFRAGQSVRIMPSELPDDGWGHEPTIRADFVEVRVSALDAAVPIQRMPPVDAAARIFKRSADEIPFWNAMLAEPEDHLPRLIYADWLAERGDPAGDIIRDGVSLILHGWTFSRPVWNHRNQMLLHWRQVQAHFHSLIAQAGYQHFEYEPGKNGAAASRYGASTRPRSTSTDGEWQGLSVTTESGEPVPPFVNYLLITIAFQLGLPEQIRAEIRGSRRNAEPNVEE